ncbi:MAG: AzlD domain-containing protein [Chloroflexi bacterium]|nr:AzlD domain-containing protein [Chloroflexota bacterium]MQC26859.1 AzlD domain-containing protein [Chloroflexota bacterium]
MNEWLLISGMALATFATRYPVLVWLSRTSLPPSVFRALKFVPASVLSAIIFPAVFLPGGELALRLNNAPLFAGLIAVFIAWRSRNLLLTILLGMAALWTWRAIFPL